ncbi:MAG: SDR family oxidoreductase, partial [Parvibaculales bacterium]
LSCDVSDYEDIERAVADCKKIGVVDILVNNAGIIRRSPAAEYSNTDWLDVIETNLNGLFYLCRSFGGEMLKQKSGKIINIASLLSFSGGITVPAYAASKGAVMQLTKALANEWAAHNVQVNAIAPGYFETDNTAALRADEGRYSEILKRIPADRWGKPHELKGACVFLASQASNYVNGHVLAVDGGFLAR